MPINVEMLNQKDALNLVSKSKIKNRPCDEFFAITDAPKSTNPLTMKEVTKWIGNSRVNLVVWKKT